jgi:signal peptidase I
MEPLIKNGNTVLVSNIFYLFKNPKVGDVVAFKNLNGKILIKRITKKENKKFFIEGDNKKDSLDSKSFGMISGDKILGKVIYFF